MEENDKILLEIDKTLEESWKLYDGEVLAEAMGDLGWRVRLLSDIGSLLDTKVRYLELKSKGN
jgi:hypothetical protein